MLALISYISYQFISSLFSFFVFLYSVFLFVSKTINSSEQYLNCCYPRSFAKRRYKVMLQILVAYFCCSPLKLVTPPHNDIV